MPTPKGRLPEAQSLERRRLIAKFVKKVGRPKLAAKKFGVSLGTIYKACEEFKVQWEDRKEFPAGQTIYTVIARLIKGQNIAQIAKNMGVSRQRVHQVINKLESSGVKDLSAVNSALSHGREKLKSLEKKIEETEKTLESNKKWMEVCKDVMKSFVGGQSSEEISKRHGMHWTGVYRILNQYGVKQRVGVSRENRICPLCSKRIGKVQPGEEEG